MQATVTLKCALFKLASAFRVEIPLTADVGDLLVVIARKGRLHFPPEQLRVYLAKDSTGHWLKDDNNLDRLLQDTVDSERFAEMQSGSKLGDAECFGAAFKPDAAASFVHVLVAAPEAPAAAIVGTSQPTKKARVEEVAISLQELWLLSRLELSEFPSPSELAAILRRPLPFRLVLGDHLVNVGSRLFDQEKACVKCDRLAVWMNHFLELCEELDSKASEASWQELYSALLHIPIRLCRANEVRFTKDRNLADDSGLTKPNLRPDVTLCCREMVFLRGEEKCTAKKLKVAFAELTFKMQQWSQAWYGSLPFILGYATSGSKLAIITIDPKLHTETIVEFRSVIAQRAEVIQVFYNLAFVLSSMVQFSAS